MFRVVDAVETLIHSIFIPGVMSLETKLRLYVLIIKDLGDQLEARTLANALRKLKTLYHCFHFILL